MRTRTKLREVQTLIFRTFGSQEERRTFGSSAFVELQYCKKKRGAKLKSIFARPDHWQDDSLYCHADDIPEFLERYADVFGSAIYPNGKQGLPDPFGPNYYPPEAEAEIEKRLSERDSEDDRVLTSWLRDSKDYNGILLLGI